jgi:hypothetical protein
MLFADFEDPNMVVLGVDIKNIPKKDDDEGIKKLLL